jgi:hypothetical protein
MRTRDSSSHLLPLLGAVVLTAGALLLQIARRPASEQVPHAGTTAGSAAGEGPDGKPQGGGPKGPDPAARGEDSFLRRLRERGL